MYSYKTLEEILTSKNINKSSLASELGISSRTLAKISKGQKISDRTLVKIADYLKCDSSELCKYVSENPLFQTLCEEKEAKISGGIYHELQVRMTYNSNHIEGSRLNEEQTRLIFETNTIDSGDGIPVDDIIETVNHFRAIDYVIDCAERELTEDIIKNIHKILKQNTKDSTLSWFAVGDWKKRGNTVGGIETAKPQDVPGKIKALLTEYNALSTVRIEDIIAFHAEFERIHPFQDGNGRVGRLIALKECLHFGIIPFIIEDAKKAFYYRGLSEWSREKGFLIDTCLDGQDTFKRILSMLGD